MSDKITAEPARSSLWPSVERAFRKAHPTCLACAPGAAKHSVAVHHRWPFHVVVAAGRPDLELDPRNLVSLCETTAKYKAENHHELIGHLANFKSYNRDVLTDAAVIFHGLTNAQIRADARWLAKERARPSAGLDLAEIKTLLDAEFPSVNRA